MNRKTGKKRRAVRREETSTHLRLCHFCLHLNESVQEIGQCKRCRRHLTFGAMLKDVTPEEVAEAWINDGFEGTEEEAEAVAADELEELAREHQDKRRTQFDADTQTERPVPPLNGLSVIW